MLVSPCANVSWISPASPLAHPLEREDRSDDLHALGQAAEREVHPGDELEHEVGQVEHRGGAAPRTGHAARRDAEQGAGRHAEHEDPAEGEPALRGVRHFQPVEPHPDGEQDRHLEHGDDQAGQGLAGEVRGLGHRGSHQPLQRAVVSLHGDADAEVDEGHRHDAAGDDSGGEVLAEADIGVRHGAVEDRPEDDEEDDRQRERENDRLAPAEERLEFQAGPAERQAGDGRQRHARSAGCPDGGAH
jgi:hypothetical protein